MQNAECRIEERGERFSFPYTTHFGAKAERPPPRGRRSDGHAGIRQTATFRAIRHFADAKCRAQQVEGFLREAPWGTPLSGAILGKRLRFAFHLDRERKVHSHTKKQNKDGHSPFSSSVTPAACHLLQRRRRGSGKAHHIPPKLFAHFPGQVPNGCPRVAVAPTAMRAPVRLRLLAQSDILRRQNVAHSRWRDS